jgi:hypothetical protein
VAVNETIITKIQPNKKKIWVKCITPLYFNDLSNFGWKIYYSDDVKGRNKLVVLDHFAACVESIEQSLD